MEILNTALVLFLIMDPLGNIPVFVSVLKDTRPERQTRIIARELCIAYVVLLVYLFAGGYILEFLRLSHEAIGISGGIILFLIALRMIFPPPDFSQGESKHSEEPFIVPLAIPAVAGPSTMAVLMLMSNSQNSMMMLGAVTLAWVCVVIILFLAYPMHRILGKKGLVAFERLMGMILVMMSVQMMLNAIQSFNLHHS